MEYSAEQIVGAFLGLAGLCGGVGAFLKNKFDVKKITDDRKATAEVRTAWQADVEGRLNLMRETIETERQNNKETFSRHEKRLDEGSRCFEQLRVEISENTKAVAGLTGSFDSFKVTVAELLKKSIRGSK